MKQFEIKKLKKKLKAKKVHIKILSKKVLISFFSIESYKTKLINLHTYKCFFQGVQLIRGIV